jgi:hypothetical protein
MRSAAPSTLRRVSVSPQSGLPSDPPQQVLGAGAEVEEVDALPVLAPAPGIVSARRGARGQSPVRGAGARPAIPAVQAAAVAAGGFVAGAAVVGLVHRRQRRTPALRGGGHLARALTRGGARKGARGAELVQIVSSRTLLVDVHLLGTPQSDR